MEKAISFSKDQKNLIWQRFVQPAGGTEPEVMQFIEICETFGLNPILGDIVFQRYNTQNGPRINFITTRDGLLRVATQQQDYVGPPIANVVKEGDEFEFVPSDGDVVHKFGEKRGRILGAYAIMKHKRFHTVSVFVDYEEYANANAKSKGGKSPIWDKMPSAMIQKVAEVFVLKRQFPLGGLYTAEEMGIDDIGGDEAQASESTQISHPETEKKSKQEKKQEKPVQSDDKQKKREEPMEDQTNEQQEKEETKQEKPEQVQPEKQSSDESSSDSVQYVLDEYKSGKTGTGIPYARFTVLDQKSNEKKEILAKGQEALDLTGQIPEEEPFNMEIIEENGFNFLVSINGQKVEQEAS